MPAPAQPVEQPRLGGRQIRVRDADGLEAEAAAPILDALCDGVVLHVARY
jgi:hypothetical protein